MPGDGSQKLSSSRVDFADIVGAQSATDPFNQVTSVLSGASARVKSVRLRFTDGDDGKDNDTKVVVYVYPGNGPAHGANGAVFVLEDVGTEYPKNHDIDLFMRLQGQPDAATFVKANGGHVYLDCFRNGNDDWHVSDMRLIVNHDDTSQTLFLGPFQTSKGSGANQWFFVANLQKLGAPSRTP